MSAHIAFELAYLSNNNPGRGGGLPPPLSNPNSFFQINFFYLTFLLTATLMPYLAVSPLSVKRTTHDGATPCSALNQSSSL